MLKINVCSTAILISLIAIISFSGCEKMDNENPAAVENKSLLNSSLPTASLIAPDIIVNTTSDVADFNGDQQVKDLPGLDGLVSLREAIIAANNTSGPQLPAKRF
jgi:hypothetical protein